MYKAMSAKQNKFFSDAQEALGFFGPRFVVSVNQHDLIVLSIDGRFVASFERKDKEDAILFYANRQVMRDNKQ